jgi:DNA-binding PadR family transcriptional regulator
MPRWDIGDSARRRESEPIPPREGHRADSSESSATVDSDPGRNPSSTTPERPESPRQIAGKRPPKRRSKHRDRDRTYSLRNSEIKAMSDIGRFRTVDVQDLSHYAYRGNEADMKRDLENLREQGLVEEKTLVRAHNKPRNVVTLTEQGHQMVRKTSGLPGDQRVYHGFVKARETNHDADLYKVYQQAAEEVREKGGKPLRVRLDFELKAMVQREKQTAKSLSEQDRRDRMETLAKEHGLTVTGTTIRVPDIQMEYETREHELERANLELLSENYRTEGIRGKAESGFTLYTRGGDAARVRRALQDTHTVERILSI